jgi:putative membrane protein
MQLSDADRARIIAAIREAEAQTSGEIFCVTTPASGGYRTVPFAWAALIALVVPLPLIHFTLWPASVIYALQLAAFLAAIILFWQPVIRYRLVFPRTKRERAHGEAVRQFLAHGLQHTEKRTGVLLFVSSAERYVEILADAGIAQKVSRETWDAAVTALTREIKAGRPADGFVAAIGLCAKVLAEHFPPGAINRDELPNAIVEL